MGDKKSTKTLTLSLFWILCALISRAQSSKIKWVKGNRLVEPKQKKEVARTN